MKYQVSGETLVSFDVTLEAESKEAARERVYDLLCSYNQAQVSAGLEREEDVEEVYIHDGVAPLFCHDL